MSLGSAKPETCPICRGPLAYGRAGAVKMCLADDMLYSLTGGGRRLAVINLHGRAASGMPGLLDAEDGQEERAQDQLAADDQRGRRRDHRPQGVLVVQVVEAAAAPVDDREDEAAQAGQADCQAEQQAALQGQPTEKRLDLWLRGQEP